MYFKVFNSVFNKTKIKKEDVEREFNPFLFSRVCSEHPIYSILVNKININKGASNIKKYNEYLFFKNCLKEYKDFKFNFKFKKSKKDIIKEIIMNHFNINEFLAQEYLKILPNNELKKILEMYSIPDKYKNSTPESKELNKIIKGL